MQLTTFGIYNLPPLKADAQEVDVTWVDGSQTMEEGDGRQLNTGTGPMFMDRAELAVTFIIARGYLVSQSYTSSGTSPTMGQMETALIDFSINVFMAGLKTLTDVVPSGTTAGMGGTAVTSRTCTALASTNYKVVRLPGTVGAEITMTFLVPSCKWTLNLTGGGTQLVDFV